MLVAIAVLTVLAGWRASQIGFNYDFEAFFPEDQPETAFYLQFREAFSTDNDFILVGLKGENGVFDRDFLQATRDLASALDTVEGVTGVIDPTGLTLPVQDPALGMVFQRPCSAGSSPSITPPAAPPSGGTAMGGTLFSEDGRSALTVLRVYMLSKAATASPPTPMPCSTPGKPSNETRRPSRIPPRRTGPCGSLRQRHGARGGPVCRAGPHLLITFLHFAFRTWWGIVIPLTVILLSGLGTLAFMEVTGKGIDIMTVVLPTIIFVVGMSDVVHIITRYLDEADRPRPLPRPAQGLPGSRPRHLPDVAHHRHRLPHPVVLRHRPDPGIRQLHRRRVFIAFGLAFSLLPFVLMQSQAPIRHAMATGSTSSPWTPWLSRWFNRILRNRRPISPVPLSHARQPVATQRHPGQQLPARGPAEDDPLRQEFNFFEDDFSGASLSWLCGSSPGAT